MNEIILACYEISSSCLPGAIAAAVLLGKTRRKPTCREIAAAALFVAYIAAVLHITGAGTFYDAARRGMPRFDQCNLIPLVNGADSVQCLLNVALFVPLGCFLGAASTEGRAGIFSKGAFDGHGRVGGRLARAAANGFVFSLAIETSQLLNNRAFDIDDLIMNTLGACAGYAVHQAGTRIARWTARRRNACADETGARYRKAEDPNVNAERLHAAVSASIAAAVFLGRFFLFDEMGAASMLYGF